MRGKRRIERLIPYKPLPSQQAFHCNRARFKGFSGPVGSGKSAALCQEALRAAYKNPGRRGLLGAPTYKLLSDATLPLLVNILDASGIPYSLHHTEKRLTLNEVGSEILLRGLSDADRLRGTNLAWFGVDELSYVKQDAWNQLEARLRDPKASQPCGFGVWTPKGHNWVWKKFVEQQDGRYGLACAQPLENEHLLKAAPDYYERLKHSLHDRTYRQEALGEYLASDSGLVYGGFHRAQNIVAAEIRRDLPLLWAFDFNVDPMCSLLAQRVRNDLYVLREIVLRRSGTKEMCDRVLAAYGHHQAGIIVYGDASGANRTTAGDTDYQIIRRELGPLCRIKVPNRNPDVRNRVELVNSKLCNAAGETTLWIHPSCHELIADFEQVTYRDESSKIQKADSARTHLSDALGYLAWEEFNNKGTAGERGKRLL